MKKEQNKIKKLKRKTFLKVKRALIVFVKNSSRTELYCLYQKYIDEDCCWDDDSAAILTYKD